MNITKKHAKKRLLLEIYLSIALFLVSINVSYAQQVLGCCTNPAAGILACSTERLAVRDTECCPSQQSNPSYYQPLNQQGPINYNDCITNFFVPNEICSDSIPECAAGCCCTDFGGTIESYATCNSIGGTFNIGVEDCTSFCQTAPFTLTATDCDDPAYVPKFTSFDITTVKGEAELVLEWQNECTAQYYDIFRCKGDGCTNFNVVARINSNSFLDDSDLLFGEKYTYMVKAYFSIQTSKPTINKTATLGDARCSGKLTSDVFCLNNTPYFCDNFNNLVPKGPACPSTKACIVSNNIPLCIDKINCNYNNANPFGLFYTLIGCENNRYCFYDRSYSTVDSCFSCQSSMSCYDYRTEDACSRDNCKIGNCKWKSIEAQLGVGVCVAENAYNCEWCKRKGSGLENSRSFNEVFDLCTKEKSDALSEDDFKCYFNNGISVNCDTVVCKDYNTEQCAAQIELDEDNKVTKASNDVCGIKVCQNIGNACVKNADADSSPDCDSRTCEADYFAPSTEIFPVINERGIYKNLLVQIYDKTSINGTEILRTAGNYTLFLCVDCFQKHPYSVFTHSRSIILSNLNAFDGDTGARLLSFQEGINLIRYYSQDPSKNLEQVKELTVEVYSNTTGPIVFAFDVTNGVQDPIDKSKYYTNSVNPTITVRFVEPAILTSARLSNQQTMIEFPANAQPSTTVSLPVTETLQDGIYHFELNAKNANNILMDQPFSATVVIDSTNPTLVIAPPNNAIINTSQANIKLTFSEEVKLEFVEINSEDITDFFSTINNKEWLATINVSDGNKNVEVLAGDFANNQVSGTSSFIVDAFPTTISLTKPKFGTASSFTFEVGVATDNNAECRYSLDTNFDFEFMNTFTTTGATEHTIAGFNEIPDGDTSTHKLYVKCKDRKGSTALAIFDINVDATKPQIIAAFAYPNPVIEIPRTTSIKAQTDDSVICKYSATVRDFDDMEGKFRGYDNNTFSTVNEQEITVDSDDNYLYFAACKNKAELISDTFEIPFEVDTTIPMTITSHTPEFFNTTKITLAIETDKIAQCQYSETDTTARSGPIFGAPSYGHTAQLTLSLGAHEFYVVCKDQYLQKFSDVLAVPFTIDITPPIILSVNDSSTIAENPEFTWNTDSLRVKWNSIEDESRISSHLYTLIESGTSNVMINWTTSYVNNEWLLVTKTSNGSSLSLANGNTYFFRVKAINVVSLSSNISESDGITIDTSLKPSSCSNGIKDGNETDIDCGGSCSPCPPSKPFCGDGIVQKPNSNNFLEECDTTNLDNKQCTDLDMYVSGTLECKGDCTFNTYNCVSAQEPTCGDGDVNQLSEECDDPDLNGKSCPSFGFSSGSLKCTSSCVYDTSGCAGAKPFICGDGIIQKPNSANFNEQCDKSALGGMTCSSFQAYSGGQLSCRSDCTFDYTECTLKNAPTCGDGAVNQLTEDCDDTDLKGATCISLGYDSGNLRCARNCVFDKSNCTVKAYSCLSNIDCASGFCNPTKHICQNPSCNDGVQNNDESDIDCGGICGAVCPNGKRCGSNKDCSSNYCSFGLCKLQDSCSDGKLTATESDIDCGGACPTKCTAGKHCNSNQDCREDLQCISNACKKPPEEEQPTVTDSDGDGMPDEWEIQNNLDPSDPNDANLDNDNDGLTNLEEYKNRTDPNNADTDGDGFSDKEELDRGTNPLDPQDFPKSNFAKIMLYILGTAVLISGFGYLAYKVIKKREEEKFEVPKREMPAIPSLPQRQIPLKREEEIRMREAIRRRQELREKEREKLFEAFGKEEKEKPKEKAKEPTEKHEPKKAEEVKLKEKAPKKKRKIRPKKPKEDVFVKLKEIAKGAKKKKK